MNARGPEMCLFVGSQNTSWCQSEQPNIERKRIIQCPKINDTQLRVTPPNQGSYNPRSPNKSAERIGKITEPPQIGEIGRIRPLIWRGGGGLLPPKEAGMRCQRSLGLD